MVLNLRTVPNTLCGDDVRPDFLAGDAPRRGPVPRRSPSRGPRAPASAPRVAAVAATTAASGERGPLAVGVAVTLMESLANGSRRVSGDCRKVRRPPSHQAAVENLANLPRQPF